MCKSLADAEPAVELHRTFVLSLHFVLTFVCGVGAGHCKQRLFCVTTAGVEGELSCMQHLRAPTVKSSVFALQP